MMYAPLRLRRRIRFKPEPPHRRSAAGTLQHFAELGRVNAQLIHEISNPLTTALLELDQAKRRSVRARQAHQSLQTIQRYIETARQEVRGEVQQQPFSIRRQLAQVRSTTLPIAQAAGVTLQFSPPPSGYIKGSAVKFQQILVNLIVNAIDAYRRDTTSDLPKNVVVELRSHHNHLIIRVIDWGEGIAARQLPRIFDPLYSTKSDFASPGLGLGLATVRQYVTTDFHGSITVTSSRRHGTEFRLALPGILLARTH